jgi:hypothetical protein
MKILFLDHQGVMRVQKFVWTSSKPKPSDFDPDSVIILNNIIQKTDCEIVISSDWKTWVDLPQMQKFYSDQGIIKTPIAYTPKYERYDLSILAEQRSKEIKGWLKNSPVDKWVAVDDLDMRSHLDNFVFVDNPLLGIKTPLLEKSISSFLCDI